LYNIVSREKKLARFGLLKRVHPSYMDDELVDELTRELSDLRLREAVLVSTLARLKATKSEAQEVDERASLAINGIGRGDRVWITNKVQKPADWPAHTKWKEDEFRSARVTKVTRRQIFILTDNGVETWRAPNNLKKAER
jgi:hypothetical protein